MTNGSMPSTNNPPQGALTPAELSLHVRRIATELWRLDRRDVTAELDGLPDAVQDTYLTAARLVALLNDQEQLRPALYDAADQLTPGGLGNLTHQHRATVVKAFICAFRVLRDHLAGRRHPETVELMRALVRSDLTRQSPAPIEQAADLAAMPTSTEVM